MQQRHPKEEADENAGSVAHCEHWPAAGSVDSQLSQHRIFLELNRADVAQCRTSAFWIVDALCVIDHVRSGIIPGSVNLAVDPFGF